MQRPRRKLSLSRHQNYSSTFTAHHGMMLHSNRLDRSWRRSCCLLARMYAFEYGRLASCFDTALQIANVCITLNEFPYVRYYMPSHHHPLGPLKPHDQTRAPPPPEGSARWRTNLARGDAARAYEAADTDFVTKLLAFMVQQNLDEYKKNNPDFPVSLISVTQ